MANRRFGIVFEHLRQLFGGRGTDPTEDGLLLRRFLDGRDEAAFTALVRSYGPLVLRVCRNVLADPGDVEDAFQATFLVFVRRAASLARPQPLGPWLYGVAYRVAVRARAQAARRRWHERQVPLRAEAEVPLAGDGHELGPVIEEEINRLPEKYRVPFVLCYLEGKTNEEAARCLGCPKGTVLSRLARGRERLRVRLTRRGVAPATAIAVGTGAAASVSEALAGGTVRMGLLFAAGQTAVAAGASAQAAALTQRVMKVMLMNRLGTLSVVLLAMALVSAGAVALARQALVHEPAREEPAASLPAADDVSTKAPAQERTPTDVFGDPLPEGAVARMGTHRLREQGGPVLGLAFGPNGTTLCSASSGQVHRWDAATGKELKSWSLPLGAGGVAPAFSHDGHLMAWEHGGEVILHDLEADKELRRLRGHQGNVLAVAFSPDGTLLASADRRGVVLLHEVATGKQLQQVMGGPALAFLPDGKVLATADRAGVRLWDVAAGKELRWLAGSGLGIACVAFAPGGKVVAAGDGDRTVRLWDAATGEELRRLEGLPGPATSLAFAEGGRTLLAGVSGPEIRLWWWDAATGKKLREVGGEEFLGRLAMAPDGKTVATGGVDRAIRLWDVASGKKLRGGEGLLGFVGNLAFAPDGKTLATASGAGLGGEHPVRLWETATGKEVGRLQPTDGRRPSLLAFAPDGKTLAVLTGTTDIGFWDPIAMQKRDQSLRDMSAPITFVYTANGKAIAATSGRVEAADRTGRPVPRVGEGPWGVASTLRELHHVGGAGEVTGVRWFSLSADGQAFIVLSAKDGKYHLVDIPTGKERATLVAPPGVTDVAFSANARVLAWRDGMEATIHLSETATGAERIQLKVEGEGRPSRQDLRALRLLFAPDGRTLAAAWGEAILLWDVTTGKELGRFRTSQGACQALAFSPDGQLLASGGSDATAVVWEVKRPAK
jgi:RNA polymerase sigma factor (sigma-70 family)